MDPEKIKEYFEQFQDWAVVFVPKFILAILIIWIGLKIAKKLEDIFAKLLKNANIDIEIEEFLCSIISVLFKIVVFLIAAGVIGIEISAIFGLLAAAGFAIGLALQGFMGNFASGLTIIFFKPYRVGDWVQVSDSFGKVKSIEIFSTTMTTPGDKTLIIPNGQVTDNIITNFSTKGKLRIELSVTMPYKESFPKVKKVIQSAIKKVDCVLQEPVPMIGIESYDSHNIIVAVRPYILPDEYWNATFEVYAAIKEAFNEHGIEVAYSEGIELGEIGD